MRQFSPLEFSRRKWIAATGATAAASVAGALSAGGAFGDQASSEPPPSTRDLTVVDLRVAPIALPDPPLLNIAGCHGPYFLRNVVELVTDSGIVGIGETHGGELVTGALEKSRDIITGQSVFAYRRTAEQLLRLGKSCYAGIELAALDAIGKATGRRLCELLGGPVRDQVEFAAYLFFRYAADHPTVLDDSRLVDDRGTGDRALDEWGEVRSPEAMADLAERFQRRWGFRVHKLKGGVFPPDTELEALRAINDRFAGRDKLRIDPNGRWTVPTAVRIGEKLRQLPLEYYEDPVDGQEAMAQVRQQTQLPLSTNSCVTSFDHIARAVRTQPIDVVLGDHHGWGGITAFQALGTIAQALGWGLSQHSNNHAGITMAAMIHVGAVTPQLTFASDTHYVWLVDRADILDGGKLAIRQGRMAVPQGPGLGVALDRDRLARAHETYQRCGMRRRDDGTTMRRFEPGWARTKY